MPEPTSSLGGPWEAEAPRVFATTHWSVVLAAREGDSDVAGRALERLCRVPVPGGNKFYRLRKP